MTFKSLIYIAPIGGSVFDSQVLSLLIEIKKNQFFQKVTLLAGITNNKHWNHELSLLLKSDLEVVLYKQYPNYPFYNMIQRKELLSVLKRILTNNTIIHLRGESLTGIIRDIINTLNYKKIKIITDIRGATIDEVSLYLRNVYNPIKYWLKIFHFKKNLKNAIFKSDHLSCVSDTLKEYLLRKSAFNVDSITVNHCIAGKKFIFSKAIREINRKKIGISDKDVLCVYVTGGNGLYQNTGIVINNIIGKGYKILNMSKEEIQSDGVINLFVPYDEVPNYLCAADIGIVWRSDNVVNNVASPVKFSEYVCCGLPVIANNGVHIINDYINETGFGITIRNFNEITGDIINSLLTIDRNKISEYSRGIFSSETIAKNYLRIYGHLLYD